MAVAIVFWPDISPMVRAFAGEWDKTNFDIRSVEMSEIMSGGPPKDGIPAIDRPEFVGLAEAADWLHPREPVIALRIGDISGRKVNNWRKLWSHRFVRKLIH